MVEHDPNATVLVLNLTQSELQQRLAQQLATMSAEDFQELVRRGGVNVLRQFLYSRDVSIREDGKGKFIFTDYDHKPAEAATPAAPA